MVQTTIFRRLAFAGALALSALPVRAQMVTGAGMPGYQTAFDLTPDKQAKNITVQQIGCTAGPNVLWPGEKATFTYRLVNRTDSPLTVRGMAHVVHYRTRVATGDIWVPIVTRLQEGGQVPFTASLPAKGTATVRITPPVPAPYGGYAIVLDMGPQGRAFGSTLARVVKPDPGKERLPTLALDMPWPFQITETVSQTFRKLGVKACRMGADYTPTTSPRYQDSLKELTQFLQWAGKNDVSVMLTVGAGSAEQPLGRGRPWLKPDNSLIEGVKEDMAWLPQYDADFQKWSRAIAARFGWPRGPVNAMELWNEPWEGVSISGWGADLPRYREMYARMADGVHEARKYDGVNVLAGGACSSSNTLDKLFPDGKDTFLSRLDFVSIHYQEMSATPSLVPMWQDRKGGSGRVQVWDTESWVANSEDRLAGVIASMRAQGQDRTVGIFAGNVFEPQQFGRDGQDIGEDANRRVYSTVQAWAPAAAVGAVQKFIGQRTFHNILFQNGLPWIFTFNGLKSPDDGTVVVVGDLGGVYNRNKLLFRQVTGLQNAPQVAKAEAALKALPPTVTPDQRTAAEHELSRAQVLTGATLTLPNPGGHFRLLDFYGNPAPGKNGTVAVPLNGLGYFLRTDGTPGSFARLTEALRRADIRGLQPVDAILHDWTESLANEPPLRVTLTNVLNHPVTGQPKVQTGGGWHRLGNITLKPGETRTLALIAPTAPRDDNAYPVQFVFDAGRDGSVTRRETLHVNQIARQTITVDGDLSDWQGVLPQSVASAGLAPNLTEQAWLPFKNYANGVNKGLATGYLACDEQFFYFAAKIADNTPYPGNVRFATRDDDAYYYPETVTDKGETKKWPAGVRHFSYRKDPDLPSGNGTDNVQIAFNVLAPEKKPWRLHPPGTMPKFMAYWDTDYEYALNQVADAYGGGTEIWRMQVPGMPRKHFYPRQPKSPYDGPVTNGKLAMRRDGSTRIVECALPWSEIPDVKRCVDRGLPIKFSFRINDNDGPSYELAQNRSVSRDNGPAFHNDWVTHWANELEFRAAPGPATGSVRSAKK